MGRKISHEHNLIRWNVCCMRVCINVYCDQNYCLVESSSDLEARAVQWNVKGYFTAWNSPRQLIRHGTVTRSDVIKDWKYFRRRNQKNFRLSVKLIVFIFLLILGISVKPVSIPFSFPVLKFLQRSKKKTSQDSLCVSFGYEIECNLHKHFFVLI